MRIVDIRLHNALPLAQVDTHIKALLRPLALQPTH